MSSGEHQRNTKKVITLRNLKPDAGNSGGGGGGGSRDSARQHFLSKWISTPVRESIDRHVPFNALSCLS